MPHVRLETLIPRASAADCFALSLSVDAHAASMSRSGERAVAGVTAGEMRLGDTVTWLARHFGVRFRMTSAITAYDAPHRFVDEQVAGPFARWQHEHLFTAVDGGTLMVDVAEFSSPLGVVGRIVDRLVLERYLTHLLRRRNEWLAARLGQSPPSGPESPRAANRRRGTVAP
ncbi:SRPBCC family protein [Xylanimonas sp. McL0601]|uniref:SRPBCC family protein n=1 Tax=Xylanimonas sp. McL0601 TaxID=3414739 RepID=UPI003CEEEC15